MDDLVNEKIRKKTYKDPITAIRYLFPKKQFRPDHYSRYGDQVRRCALDYYHRNRERILEERRIKKLSMIE